MEGGYLGVVFWSRGKGKGIAGLVSPSSQPSFNELKPVDAVTTYKCSSAAHLANVVRTCYSPRSSVTSRDLVMQSHK